MARGQQMGTGSSSWDSAMKTPVSVPTGSNLNAASSMDGSAPGTGVRSAGAGDHLEGAHEFDGGALLVPAKHGGSGMAPGCGTGVSGVGGVGDETGGDVDGDE